MQTKMIIVKSITYAMRGEKILNQYGISCRMERNTIAANKYGCGYGLRVYIKDVDRAVQILQANNIKMADIMN